MKVLDAAAMQGIDRRAIDEIGIPSLVLMENAASGVADAIGQGFPEAESVAIVCGPGNNGGDGLALGRILWNRGYEVSLVLVHGGKRLSADADRQRQIVQRMGIVPAEVHGMDDLPRALAAAAEGADLVVDALFGTGLDRPLAGLFAATVEALDDLGLPLVAVDLPSGLDASRSDRIGPNTHAVLTVALAAPKPAHVLGPASEACGRIAVVDLGIPDSLVQEAPGFELLEGWRLADLLPPRDPESHKGTYGHLLVVAGAAGTLGAALLATRAAVRCGAGLVTLGVCESLAGLADASSLESMTLALPETDEGRLARSAAAVVLGACASRDALALGSGTGAMGETGEAVRQIVLQARLPLVLDADGINVFAGEGAELAGRTVPTVLTPHPGEIGRLLDRPVPRSPDERRDAALEAARLTGAVVVLKGHQTLVAGPEGELAVNPTGNPGLATGGSGDVLTGVIGALLARGLEAFDAACLGAYAHGAAGDRVAEEQGEEGLVAGDLVKALPEVLRDLASL